ncbi:hypothetical protein CCACVL1_06225 [Corchorus capsularis]|uniref:Uncharacterized protein n=1 Tax=Corchorus capsularis TaxID=210143 RepID=A0A1R3JGQ1_COCAP|nr:hypothetical protein CCACVL1_06225 [Corchorus capsularis]
MDLNAANPNRPSESLHHLHRTGQIKSEKILL